MLKTLLFSCLLITAFSYEECFKNLGNVETLTEAIYSLDDSATQLDACKGLCDTWSYDCTGLEGAAEDCTGTQCKAGVLTETGCILYATSEGWEDPVDDTVRNQAFERCDPACWDEYVGKELIDLDNELQTYEGAYTEGDCQSRCVDFNSNCALNGCTETCGGIAISDSGCVISKIIEPVEDLQFSDDESKHFGVYLCEVELVEDQVEEEASVEINPDQTEDDLEGGNEVVVEEEVVQGSGECTETTIYEGCYYTGASAVVDLQILELDWEPMSWCVPEHQTLILHNAYNLGGEAATYDANVECTEDIDYSFLKKNSIKKRVVEKKSKVSVL